jgi:nucleotide-binding universal stress UspA family protein
MENDLDIFPPLVCPAQWDTLMVCTDGSAGGNNAVAVTLELAQACRSKVVAVQALDVRGEFQAGVPDQANLEQEVRKNLEEIKAAADKLEVPLETASPVDQPAHAAIVAAAEKVQPDLVIMGRRGKHRGLAAIFMGSVTAKVIGRSPVNVLVVPRGGSIGFQRILVASDGSAHSEGAWELALAMAQKAESRLIAVAVAPEEGDIIQAKALVHKMLTAANRAGMPLKGVSPQGVAPDAGIIHQAVKNEVDLIILGSHGRTGLKKLFMGSVTERVIGQAPCPVLVVKK